MNIPYVMKKCNKCGRWLVANTDNFYKAKTGKYRLRGKCKECVKRVDKEWRQANKDRKTKNNKQYYQNNKEKIAEHYKQYYQNNKDRKAEYAKRYHEDNKEKIAEHYKQYYETNKDKILERQKQYQKQYYQSPQGQVANFNKNHRRRIKEEQQGAGITKDQWLEMMNFFNWRCAYSGEALTKDNRSVDHVASLNSGGDNMIWNCVPMTRSLNSSKCDKDMLEWYKQQGFYSEERLAKIRAWQEYAYNKYNKEEK